VDGVVLAREYLGRDPWHVWDMRPGRVALCKPCSSEAERIITHASGRCPKIVRQAAVAEVRVALAREAIDARSRLAAIRSGQEREELDEEQEDEPEAEPGAAEAGHEHSAAAEEQVALVAAGDVDGDRSRRTADDEVKGAGQSDLGVPLFFLEKRTKYCFNRKQKIGKRHLKKRDAQTPQNTESSKMGFGLEVARPTFRFFLSMPS